MFLKKAALPIILVIFSTCFFYFINSNIKPFNEWPSIKYTSGDSTTYLNVGKWLIGDKKFSEVKNSIAIRPFFYPLLVILLEKIHPWAISIFQFMLWEIQILLVYFSGFIISKSSVASFFAFSGLCGDPLANWNFFTRPYRNYRFIFAHVLFFSSYFILLS